MRSEINWDAIFIKSWERSGKLGFDMSYILDFYILQSLAMIPKLLMYRFYRMKT